MPRQPVLVQAIDLPNPVQVYKDYLSKTEEHCQPTGEPEIDKEAEAAPECVDTACDQTVCFDSDEDAEKSVLSFHFPSESPDDEVAARPMKKTKLFSDNCDLYDSPVEVSKEMFSITPAEKTGMDNLSETEELLNGLRETASVDLCKDDVEGVIGSKAGRFQRDGEFGLPYSRMEEEAMVSFFMNKGGFKLRKGNKVWQQMENSGICPGRTWQSMKQKWNKYVMKRLDKFGVTIEEMELNDMSEFSAAEFKDETETNYTTAEDDYTNAEDEKILNYIMKNNKFKDLGGNALWLVMELKGVLPGRSGSSLKERFRKVIVKQIQIYNVSEKNMKRFKSAS